MAYEQQAGRANVESAAVNYLTDGDKKKKKKEGKSTTTTTSKAGVTNPDFPDSKRTGTLYTDTVTTTIDGTSGKPSASGNLPKKSYAQLEAEGGDVAAAIKWNASKKMSTPASSSSTSTTRFKPDDLPPITKLEPYGIKTQTPMPTAPVIGAKPFSDLVTMKISKGPGVGKTGRRKAGILNSAGGLTEHTMDETVVTRDERSRLQMGVRLANQDLKDRYNPDNIRKEWKGNPKGMANALANGKERIAANLTTMDGSRDVYDAEALTIKGGKSRVNNKNRPARQAATKAAKISKKKNLDTAKATKKAAVAKNRAAKIAARKKN
tara:strand:- start:37 stop:1002 length:966 start_codon:yes stop_codon:yes gene_type:complete